MQVHRPFLTCALAALAVAAAPVRAQSAKEKQAAQLAKLLDDLKQLPPAAWDARVAALRAQIDAHTGKAAKLRTQADELRHKAAAEDARAKAVEKEIARLRAMMALVEPAPTEVAKAMAEPAAMKKAKPGKAKPEKTAKKPEPEKASKKPEPKKASKKPEPEKASKKPEPEKPEPKKASKKTKPENPEPKKPAKKPEPKAQPEKTAATSMTAMAPSTEPLITYEEHILPILEENCMVCHDADEASGGLNMETFASLMEGGSSGSTIVPGNPGGSRLYRLVSYQEKPYMPRDADKLPAGKIELIRRWIAAGAPLDTDAAKVAAAKAAASPTTRRLATSFDGPPAMPEQVPVTPLAEVVHAPALRALATSPRAPLIAVAGNQQILLHDAESLARIAVLPFPLGQIECLTFTADGRRLLAAGGFPGKRGGAVLYDVTTGAIVQRYGRDRDSVLAAAIAPDQSLVALGGARKKVHVFDAATGHSRYDIDAHTDFITAIDISPDARYLATADRAGVVRVWQAATGRDIHTIRPGGGAVHALRFRPDGTRLAVATDSGTVRCYELDEAKQVFSENHGAPVLCLAWAGNDQRLATGGSKGRVKLWKPDGGRLATSPALGDWIYALAFDHTGKKLFTGDWHGRLRSLDDHAKPRTEVTPTEAERGAPSSAPPATVGRRAVAPGGGRRSANPRSHLDRAPLAGDVAARRASVSARRDRSRTACG